MTKPKGVLMDLEGRVYALVSILFCAQKIKLVP